MRKSSKILAVVIAVALLCAAIATMVSATAGEIIYPEYTAPGDVTKLWNIDFNDEKLGSFSAKTEYGIPAPTTVDNGSGNRYVNITNWDSEAQGIVEHITGNAYGNICNAYTSVIGGSYFVWSFDVMADKYATQYTEEGKTINELISIEEYNELPDEEKPRYWPSYTQTYIMAEIPKVSADAGAWIIKDGNQWYFTDSNGKNGNKFALPSEAGVWTNIQMIIKTDLQVRYTEGEETKTVPYSEYNAIADKSGYTNAKMIVNTETAIYANGEYKYDVSAASITGAEYDYDDYFVTKAETNEKLGGQFKYAQLKAGKDSSARVTAPMSICFDNIGGWTYPTDYEGDFATAFENRASLLDAKDAIFNQNYNLTNSLAATVTTADGTYVYGSVEQAFNAAVDGSTVEIFINNYATLNVSTGIENLTVKTNGKAFNYTLPEGYPYECNEVSAGVYEIVKGKYAAPVYVGPTTGAKIDANKEFENGTDSITCDKGVISVGTATMGGNTYAQMSWTGYTGTATVANEQVRPGNLGANGGYASDIIDDDIFTLEFDLMADKYRNISTKELISIEAYEALEDAEKANYEPSYHGGYFYIELSQILKSGSYEKMPRIGKFNGVWSIFNGSNVAPLSTQAGVWNHISCVFNISSNVTYYTDDTKTTTAVMPIKDYRASGMGEERFVKVDSGSSTFSVYVDGEYGFDIPNWFQDITSYTYTDKKTGKVCTTYDEVDAKYVMIRGASSSTSTFSNNFSMGIDNYKTFRFAQGATGDYITAITNKTSFVNCEDAPFNKNYNKTHLIAGVTAEGADFGYYVYNQNTINANLSEKCTLELFANMTVPETPLAEVFYIKTNGYKHLLLLPDGYTCYETETKGTYVVKVAGPEDMVDVEWIVNGEVYATTKEYIGATPAGPEYALTKVHPWVSQYVESWADAEGNNVVKPGKNTFIAVMGYEATPEIMMNITTTQALVTNVYIPALTDEELAEISGVYFAQGKKAVPEDASGNKFGSRANVTINGKRYFIFSETMRIIYQEENRSAVLSFSYKGVELSLTFLCESRAYFNTVLSSDKFSTVEKELIYSALVYADNVTRYSGSGAGYSALVADYAQYKSGSTLAEIIASAKKENTKSDLITGYSISVKDGYAARLMLTLDKNLAGADFTRDSAKLSYKDVRNNPKTTGFDSYADGTLLSSYGNKIYNMRQTFDIIVGEEVVGTFNLAAYIADLAKKGYAEDSTEMQIALSIYHYSECSEAYKIS